MKKLLCLVLSVVMAFSCVGPCLTASAAEYYERPDAVAKVIDPILAGTDTDFAHGITVLGYDGSNSTVTKDALANRINNINNNIYGSSDKMFGVDVDFLYYNDTSSFIWDYCKYEFGINCGVLKDIKTVSDYNNRVIKLQKENKLKELAELVYAYNAINKYLASVSKDLSYFTFRSYWNSNDAFTIHNIEVYAAETLGKKSTCQAKGWYDACSAVLYGYEYEYGTKSFDTQIFEDIVETKIVVYNNKTRRNEAHYNYYYYLDAGQFSLTRSNSNFVLNKIMTSIIGNGNIYKDRETANASAIKLANFIGNLLYPNFDEIPEDTKIFTDNVRIVDVDFFRAVAEVSGLDDILQANWIDSAKFDVKKIMNAFGVSTDDNVILDAELEKGNYMGARILTDIYRNFVKNPMGYIEEVLQVFCRSYSTYAPAIQGLFIMKFPEIASRSRDAGDYVASYDGFELTHIDGLINFIADCIYFEKVDDGLISTADEDTKFTFAPIPVKRFANAKDMNELHLYLLCYFDINRAYAVPKTDAAGKVMKINGKEDYSENSVAINNFFTKAEKYFNANYTAETKKDDISNMMMIFSDMFNGTLTVPSIRSFYLGIITADVVVSFPNNFSSKIKNALADLLNNFIAAMNKFMNLLFGWTDGLFDKDK